MMDAAELQRRLRDVRDEATGLRVELAARDAEIARLREALRPLADLADEAETMAKHCKMSPDSMILSVEYEDALAVRAALESPRSNPQIIAEHTR